MRTKLDLTSVLMKRRNSLWRINKRNFGTKTKGPGNKVNEEHQKNFGCIDRTVTNKYWCFFFLFIFITWMTAWYFTIYYHEPGFKTDLYNTTLTNSTKVTRCYFWGENWLFDACTCNVAFLSVHYENSGSIVIWVNVLFCCILIIYSQLSLRRDKFFYFQFQLSGVMLGTYTISSRLVVYISSSETRSSLQTQLLFHEKFHFWLIPELIFVIILYTKRPYTVIDVRKFKAALIALKMLPLYTLGITCVLILPTSCIIASSTMNLLNNFGKGSALSYMITGCSWYLTLTYYYFWKMVASCMTDITLRRDCSQPYDNLRALIDSPKRALLTVWRYHLGTVCYHATLIFPRLETLLVMNEPEIKKLHTEVSKHSLYAAHWDFHNLSLVTTVLCGSDHSESMRKLSRTFASDLQRLEYFGGFNQVIKSSLALLMSTNSLMIITLWAYGVNDVQLSMTSWTHYITVMLYASVFIKVFDVIWNTFMFYTDYVLMDYKEKTLILTNKSLI